MIRQHHLQFGQDTLIRVLGLATPLAFWEWASQTERVNSVFLPPPSDVIPTALDLLFTGTLNEHINVTLQQVGVSLAGTILVGVVLGVVISRSKLIAQLAEPLVYAIIAAPNIAFVGIFIALFGLGSEAVIAQGFVGGFPYVAINAATGMRQVDSTLVRVGQVFGATGWKMALKILIPSAIPPIVAGIRLAIPRVVNGVIAGQLFAGAVGLGYQLAFYGNYLDTKEMYGVVVWLAVLGVTANFAFSAVESRFASWQDR
ncbi:MAG: ABC transporter permease subunit [Dehalococcoidia bacterium]|nr:ABC transporter permease subunit [Dehalococcoidia bacterium]